MLIFNQAFNGIFLYPGSIVYFFVFEMYGNVLMTVNILNLIFDFLRC